MRLALTLATLLLAGRVSAQQPRLEVELPPAGELASGGARLRALSVVSDEATRELLESGFPTRLHFRVELWSAGRVFDVPRNRAEWDVFVYYDALGKRYRVVRVEADGDRISSAGQFGSFDEMVREVERPAAIPIRPQALPERQYFVAVLEVETLSVTDLDEVGRWLRGEMQPAVRGNGNPGTALGRGLRRLFVRLLGAERRNLQVRSPAFLVPG